MQRRLFLKWTSSVIPFGIAGHICMPDGQGEKSKLPAGMRLPDELKEAVWEIREDRALARKLMPNGLEDRDTHAYALYLEYGDTLVHVTCFSSSNELVTPKLSFRRLFAQVNPCSWQELLFACAIHNFCIYYWTGYLTRDDDFIGDDPLANWPSFTPHPLVDEILKESRGALLWAHQMHSLYGLFESSHVKALAFRSAVNSRRADWIKAATGRYFIDGQDLMDIVWERMIFHHTGYLNTRMAYLVSQHFSVRG